MCSEENSYQTEDYIILTHNNFTFLVLRSSYFREHYIYGYIASLTLHTEIGGNFILAIKSWVVRSIELLANPALKQGWYNIIILLYYSLQIRGRHLAMSLSKLKAHTYMVYKLNYSLERPGLNR